MNSEIFVEKLDHIIERNRIFCLETSVHCSCHSWFGLLFLLVVKNLHQVFNFSVTRSFHRVVVYIVLDTESFDFFLDLIKNYCLAVLSNLDLTIGRFHSRHSLDLYYSSFQTPIIVLITTPSCILSWYSKRLKLS